MMKRELPEYAMYRQIVDTLRYARPGVVWWHTPNEGKRNRATGGILKAMGMKPGVADFLFVIPPDGKLAALEIKAPGNKPTAAQAAFLQEIQRAGGLAAWCDTWELAIKHLAAWGILPRMPELTR